MSTAIFFASSTGNSDEVASKISSELGEIEVFNLANTKVDKINEYGEAEKVPYLLFKTECEKAGIPLVKEVFNKEFNSKEELLAECNNYFKTNMIEGIVVRTVDSKFSAKVMNLEYDSKK